MQYMDMEGVDAIVARRILETAEDMRIDRDKAHYKAMQVAVQNGVAKAFGGRG